MREVAFPEESAPVRPAGQPVPPPRVRMPDSLGAPRSLQSLEKRGRLASGTMLTPRQKSAAPGLK